MSNGALKNVTNLYLQSNMIGDLGMSLVSLREGSVQRGALAPGSKVFLSNNNATKTDKQAICNAAKARGRDKGEPHATDL